MTSFTRSLALTVPAALIGASLFAGPVLAQNSNKPQAAAAATSSKPETVEQRIADLHAKLQITPAEEPKWKAVAEAMRDNAANMEKLVQSRHDKDSANMTAVDDLTNYQTFAQAHADGLKKVTTAFEDLYNSMPDSQKKVADAAFQKYGS